MRKGHSCTEATKQLLREINLGKKQSEESNRKRSETLRGHEVSKETKEFISTSNKGKKRTEEQRKQMSISQKKRFENPDERIKCGHTVSDEQKKQISKDHTGLKHSNEAKLKISIASKLHWEDEEYKEKISKASSGGNHWTVKYGLTISEELRIYPLKFNKTLKDQIKNRDNCICQWCGKTESQEGRKLSIHHIDHDRSNLEFSNLITLCKKCNSAINGRQRTYWTNVFNFLMAIKDKKERLLTNNF